MKQVCEIYVDGVLLGKYEYVGTYDGKSVYQPIKKAGKKMNSNTKTVNWSEIISNLGRDTLRGFANGEISGRGLYESALAWGGSAEVRNLLRSRGVNEARKLARKALSRR